MMMMIVMMLPEGLEGNLTKEVVLVFYEAACGVKDVYSRHHSAHVLS